MKRDHELFAHVFETWIEDELIDRGICGTRYGGPYPQGEEVNQSMMLFAFGGRFLMIQEFFMMTSFGINDDKANMSPIS
ncbi:hypothetical protein [Paenibacillus guangzhouensis]|uniref:hypothetical protein n=1 Tax=Paenibacillus guangzhouensis TaxID=1473112 RepID=UPI001266ABFC|nr:hypothetical protein [Paenibacillus guangzhouensis]